MIEKKCKNCVYFNNSVCSAFLNKKWCNLKFFKSSEQAIRKDERKKIIDELWLSITDDKKIIFEKDGHEFKLNLVPIINSEEE